VRALLRKDLRLLGGRDDLLALGVYLIVSLQFVRYDEAFFWSSVCFAGALVVIVPVVEWLLETDAMTSSLPVRRSTIVFARYVAAVAGCTGGAIVWISSGRLLSPILASGRTAVAMWGTLDGILTYLLVTCLFTALFLPLYFRFGLGRGSVAFTALALALVAAASLAFDRAEAVAPGLVVRLPAATIRDGVGVFMNTAGPAAAVTAVVAGLALIFTLSGWISVKAFARRDL